MWIPFASSHCQYLPVIWGVYSFFGIWQLMCVLGIWFMHSLLGGVSVYTIHVSTQMLFAHLWFPSPSSHFQWQPSRQETPLCTTSSGSPMRNLIKYKINSKYILNTKYYESSLYHIFEFTIGKANKTLQILMCYHFLFNKTKHTR